MFITCTSVFKEVAKHFEMLSGNTECFEVIFVPKIVNDFLQILIFISMWSYVWHKAASSL